MNLSKPKCTDCGMVMQALFTSTQCFNDNCRKKVKTFHRKPRVIGRAPDMWHGAGAKLRMFEGTPITMILHASDIKPVRVHFNWMALTYCDAPDFDFTTKGVVEAIRQRSINPAFWNEGLPCKDHSTAESYFDSGYILLVLGHGDST